MAAMRAAVAAAAARWEVERVAAGGAKVTMAALVGVDTVAVAMVVVTGVERAAVATEAVVQEASMAAR